MDQFTQDLNNLRALTVRSQMEERREAHAQQEALRAEVRRLELENLRLHAALAKSEAHVKELQERIKAIFDLVSREAEEAS